MDLAPLMALLRANVSGEHSLETAATYRAFPLKLSFSSYNAGIEWVRGQYEMRGLKAKKIEFPADGKTTFGDRHFPLAWDIEDGWLEVAAGAAFPTQRLAAYLDDPYGIVPFSADSQGEQSGFLVPATEIKAGRKPAGAGAIVALFDREPRQIDIHWALDNGCKAVAACYKIDPTQPVAYQVRRWFNAMFGEGQIDARSRTLPAYSLPLARVVELLDDYKQHGPMPVRYLMRAKTYTGTMAAVLATMEGTDPQAKTVMLSAHAYEPNASNNVAGVAICLEAAKRCFLR